MTELHEELVLKLLNGTILPDEQKILDAWIEQSPSNKKLVEDFNQLWLAKSKVASVDFETVDEWSRFSKSIDAPVAHAPARVIPLWLKIAASITVILLASYLYFIIVPLEISIQSGNDMMAITLPDQSRVWLNRNTEITYEPDYNTSERKISINGEAFFDVTKDPNKPFIITSADAQVRVLGTSFNVQAYRDAVHTQVFVVTGLVRFASIENTNRSVELRPGQIATLSNGTDPNLSVDSATVNPLSWRDKKLTFKKASVEQMIASLQRYFNVKIEANAAVMHCRFTGSFIDPSLSEILETLSISLNVNITERNQIYFIEGSGC